jgi:hypothetical protein
MDPFEFAEHLLGTNDLEEHNEEAERNRQTACQADNTCGLCSSLPQYETAKQSPTKPPRHAAANGCADEISSTSTARFMLSAIQYFGE